MSESAQSAVAKHVSFERERGVHEVHLRQDVAHIVVMVSGSEGERMEKILRVFHILADNQIPIFFIKLHRSVVTFAVEGEHLDATESALRPLGWEMVVRCGLALVSIHASSMRDLTGSIVTIADAFQEVGARLYGVSDSHTSIQCLIDAEHSREALEKLKQIFHLEAENA